MKNSHERIFGLSLISILLFSCQPESIEKMTTSTTLINGEWKLFSIMADPPIEVAPEIALSDLTILQEDCTMDNTLQFYSDFTFTVDEGLLKCDTLSPKETSNGSWLLSSDNKMLMITEAGRTVDFTIQSIDQKELQISSPADQIHPFYPPSSTITLTYHSR